MPDEKKPLEVLASALNEDYFKQLATSEKYISIVPDGDSKAITCTLLLPEDTSLERIEFSCVKLIDDVYFNVDHAKTISFDNCEFKKNITISAKDAGQSNASFTAACFSHCDFTGKCKLRMYTKNASVYFDHCNFQTDLVLTNHPVENTSHTVSLLHGNIGLLDLVSSSIEGSLIFEPGKRLLEMEKLRFSSVSIENICGLQNVDIESADLETMRQIKTHALKNQDRLLSAEFYKREMEYLCTELKKRKGHFWDRKLLQLNALSNKHGTSWTRGLGFTLVTMSLLYLVCLCSLDTLPFEFGEDSPHDLLSALSTSFMLFFEFLIPTHKMHIWADYGPNGLTYFVDVISRLWLGYGTYQTLVAFRRFSSR